MNDTDQANETSEATTRSPIDAQSTPRSAEELLAAMDSREPTDAEPTRDQEEDEERDEPEVDSDGQPDDGDGDLSLKLGDDDQEQEEEDDLSDDAPSLELDEELAANPKLKKRWDEMEKGVQKLLNRAKERETAATNMLSWQTALSDPATARDALKTLAEQVAKLNGFTVQEAFGFQTSDPAADADVDYGDSEWERAGYQSRGEWLAEQRAKKAAEELYQKLRAEVAPATQELERMRAERADAERRQQFERAIDQVAPKVIKRLEAQELGWKVTKEMIAEAAREMPRLAEKNLPEAVRKWHAGSLAQHLKGAASKTRAKAPDLVNGANSRPRGTSKPAHERTAHDYLADLGFTE